MHILLELTKSGLPIDLHKPLNELAKGLENSPADIQGIIYPSVANNALKTINNVIQLQQMTYGERRMCMAQLDSLANKTVYQMTGDIATLLELQPSSDSKSKELQLSVLKDLANTLNNVIDRIEKDDDLTEINYDLANIRFNTDLVGHMLGLDVEAQQLALILEKRNCVYLTHAQAVEAKQFYQERGIESVIKSFIEDGRINSVLISLEHSQPDNYGFDNIHPNTVLPKPNKPDPIKLGPVHNLK